MRLMCATVFCCFSFLFLYCFQADVIFALQHVMSGGRTYYAPLFGSVLITLVLQLLQLVVYLFSRLKGRSHALTYFPSMLMLALLTDVNIDGAGHISHGGWWWGLPLALAFWLLIVYVARKLSYIEPGREPAGLLSRLMWINMLLMALQIIIAVSCSNTHAVFHYRMRAEMALLKGDYARALSQGKESLESDASLQMIRMYALARCGQLPEKLFSYPVAGNSSAMLPVEGRTAFVFYPVDSLYRFLGARPRYKMTVERYLQQLQRRDSAENRRATDYQLCGLLIDRRLDDFARLLRQRYAKSDTLDALDLPRHYREAMTLYTHLRANPVATYRNSVMEEDWQNLQELEARYPDPVERKGKVEESYRDTYWYYYEYE